MPISSVLSSGLAGIQAGIARVDRASSQIAQFGTHQSVDSLAAAMTDQRTGEIEVKLAADVVKVADELLGTLIDIRA